LIKNNELLYTDNGNLNKIIKKFENSVFCGKNNSYEIFKLFDNDKDGNWYI
jgi:hypothetical protein